MSSTTIGAARFKPVTMALSDVELMLRGRKCTKVGSSLIEGVDNPQDIDYLVLDELGLFETSLDLDSNWTRGGSMPATPGKFSSFKAYINTGDVVNLILVRSLEEYNRFAKASQVCVDCNIVDKVHRVAVHEQIRVEGGWASGAKEVDWPLYYFGLEGAYVQAETTDSLPF